MEAKWSRPAPHLLQALQKIESYQTQQRDTPLTGGVGLQRIAGALGIEGKIRRIEITTGMDEAVEVTVYRYVDGHPFIDRLSHYHVVPDSLEDVVAEAEKRLGK